MPKSSDSIRVSEKHGVNPTIPVCFWCGKEKNEIALMGKLPNDEKAPSSMWIFGDYEPCEECKELRKMGVDLMEACVVPVFGENQPPIFEKDEIKLYPTGRHMILKDGAINSLFPKDTAETLCEKRLGFLDPETMDMLFVLAGHMKKE